jgi:chromosomal replication initiator protein
MARRRDSSSREPKPSSTNIVSRRTPPADDCISSERPSANAREALKDIALQDEETIDATKIVEIVCKFYGVKKEELLARKRTKNIAEARQIAMYLITEYLNIPLESVGNIFGKDHSTVIYAKNKVAEDIKKSKKLEVQINDLKQMIEGK